MKKVVQDAIDILKGLDLSKYPFNDIVTQINNVGTISYIVVTFPPGKFIYRARLNESDDHYFSVCQLTYKPQQYNKTCQRASTPNMTMFYGSVLPEEVEKGELDEVRVVPSYEAIPWLRDKTTKGIKKITFTKWKVTRDIKLIAILQHGNFYDKSSFTKKIMDEYEASLNNMIDYKDETIAFMSFIANEFSKDVESSKDYNYLISAAFTETLVKNGYDGVLYPSVRLEGKGFNVALTPQAADMKLQLDVVVECTAYKFLDKTVMDNDFQAKLDPNQTHFEFQKVDAEYHAGASTCIEKLGLDSINQLK